MSERVVAGDQLNLPGDQRRGELQQRRPWSMSPTVVLFQNRARAGHPRPRRPSPPCPRCPSHVSFFLSPSGVSYLSLFVHRYLGAPIAPVRLCSCLRQAKAAGPRRRSKQEPWLKLQCAAPPRLLPNLPGRPPLLDPVQRLVDQLDASRGRASAVEPLAPLRLLLLDRVPKAFGV